jgi:hypothetical protein
MFSCKCFLVSNERYVSKEQSRIRIAAIYFHHSSHMHILIWLYDSTFFAFEVWLYNICIASVLFHALINSHELHISLSVGRRHNIIPCLGEDPQIPHIWETWEHHTMNLWVLFWKLIKLWNYGWTKSLRHGAWLDHSIFQLLMIQVKAQKPHGWR